MPSFPGYTYDPATGYVSATSGRTVSQRSIDRLMDAHIAEAERRLTEVTAAAQDDNIDIALWGALMTMELERLYLQMVALGAGGIGQLSAADYAEANSVMRRELGYLAGFAAALVSDDESDAISPGHAAARIAGYVGAARILYWATQQRRKGPRNGMVPLEIRDLHPTAIHCRDCPGHSARGYQPVGVLPVPGRRCACGNNCRCTMRTVWVPEADAGELIGTRVRV